MNISRVPYPKYFTEVLQNIDPEVYGAIHGELRRQQEGIELIASENIVSSATLEALGSVMINKTVEGYPGRRYYGGAQFADDIENLAIERAKRLFGCCYANVQPHSGSQANQAVYLALLKPGDTILSMSLESGGHLSHGAKPNLTGKWLNPVQYGVRASDGLIDYDQVEKLSKQYRPKLIICGGSAYPRAIDFERFRRISDTVDAWLLADIAHFAGLVVGNQHPSPFGFAHVVTTTTYKNLRGARGGLILTDDLHLSKKLNAGIFPGIQGSANLSAIAAKAVCLGEALRPEFKDYAKQVLRNSRVLAKTLVDRNIELVTGGTDTPLMLADLRCKGITGARASESLEASGLTCNKNTVPGDQEPPSVTSGLRFGVAAGTTRGFNEAEFCVIGNLIADVIDGLTSNPLDNSIVEETVRNEVKDLCSSFPIYPSLG